MFELLIISVYFDCKFFKARRITLYLYRAEHMGSGLILGPVGLPVMQIITTECYQTLRIFFFNYLKVRSRSWFRTRVSDPATVQRLGKGVVGSAN